MRFWSINRETAYFTENTMQRGLSMHKLLEKGQPGYDRLFKVHPILDFIILCVTANYGLSKALSLDERNIAGRSTLKVI